MAATRFKLYPDLAGARRRRIVADVLVIAWTAASAVAGLVVYTLVIELQVVGGAITDIGQRLNQWIDAFGAAVPGQNVPIVGSTIGDYVNRLLASLQRASGDAVIRQGQAVSDAAGAAALALGVIAGLVMVSAVTPWYLVRRWRGGRELGAMVTFLESANVPRTRALLAHRAAITLPVWRVMAVTRDPIADLTAGRYDALAAELLASLGLEPGRIGLDGGRPDRITPRS